MAQRSLRFGIHDGAGHRAATWKLWTKTGTGQADVYLASRSLGGALKVSLHQSGNWHLAYSERTFEEKIQGVFPKLNDRFIERWTRPPEIAPGTTLACRIVTPWASVTSMIQGPKVNRVIWLPNAPESNATEIAIFLIKSIIPDAGWPAKRSMRTHLIGSFPIESGETVCAVYHVVAMPDFSNVGKVTGHFCKGASKEDLEGEGLRVIAFGSEVDGSRVIYDIAVQGRSRADQMQAPP